MRKQRSRGQGVGNEVVQFSSQEDFVGKGPFEQIPRGDDI